MDIAPTAPAPHLFSGAAAPRSTPPLRHHRPWRPKGGLVTLEMDEEKRSRKLTRFGSVKHVYPAIAMKEMRDELTRLLRHHLPEAKVLYWT